MKISVFILLLVVAVASAAVKPRQKRSTYTANLNEFTDKLMVNLQQYIVNNEWNEFSLPNVTQSFSTTPLWITYSGRLSLYKGLLSNLQTIRRFGDVDIAYAEKLITITGNLGCDVIDVDYNYQARLIGISASGSVDGEVKRVDTTVTLGANLQEYQITKGEMVINQLGSVTAKLRGNAVIDWLSNVILAIVVEIIKDDIVVELNGAVNNAIDDIIDNLNESISSILS